MLPFVVHVYHFAEVYTVVLAWVVIPLAFFASYRFFQTHYGMFRPTANDISAPVVSEPEETPQEEHLDGAA